MRRKWFIGVVLAGALAATACDDDEVTDLDPSAPALPPASSMQFDLGFFDGANPATAGDTRIHWLTGALTVAALNTMVTTALTPPAFVLGLALDTTPSYLGDDTFMWIYTWTNGVDDVQIRLRGQLVESVGADRVDWELRVTNTAEGQDNALWFGGDSAINGRSGQWTFYDLEGGNEVDPFVVVDWAVNDVDDVEDRDLTFGVLMGENAGDSLTYDVLSSDIHVTVYDAADDASIDIAWNEDTGAGYIEAPGYNNGDRGCWDEMQFDVECPPVEPAL